MSVQKILQESIEKNPLNLKEAFVEELRARLGLALEAKMQGNKKDEEDEDDKEKDEKHESFDLSDFTVEELEDFMMSEEFKQLDEISTSKLARYMKRASDDLANNSANREFMKANLPNFTDKDERTKEKVDNTFKKMIGKRKAGIEKAASKIARKHSED